MDTTKRIRDEGCGTGRHSLELARRGYRVTGIDLSQHLLDQAHEKAHKENLVVEFVAAADSGFDRTASPSKDHFELGVIAYKEE